MHVVKKPIPRYLVSKKGLKTKYPVYAWCNLCNGWEYYFGQEVGRKTEIAQALVWGAETEIGDVYLPEIKPYLLSCIVYGDALYDLAPPPEWEWAS